MNQQLYNILKKAIKEDSIETIEIILEEDNGLSKDQIIECLAICRKNRANMKHYIDMIENFIACIFSKEETQSTENIDEEMPEKKDQVREICANQDIISQYFDCPLMESKNGCNYILHTVTVKEDILGPVKYHPFKKDIQFTKVKITFTKLKEGHIIPYVDGYFADKYYFIYSENEMSINYKTHISFLLGNLPKEVSDFLKMATQDITMGKVTHEEANTIFAEYLNKSQCLLQTTINNKVMTVVDPDRNLIKLLDLDGKRIELSLVYKKFYSYFE